MEFEALQVFRDRPVVVVIEQECIRLIFGDHFVDFLVSFRIFFSVLQFLRVDEKLIDFFIFVPYVI